jgi:anti-sigma factor RsiW
VFGSALSAAAAALLMIALVRSERRGLGASALASGQPPDRRADQQPAGVNPWFSDRLGVALPVPDLTSQGFNLIGGRIDYVFGKAVAAIVYRRSDHVINLLVAQGADAEHSARVETVQGLNVELWSEQGQICAPSAT